MMGAKLWVPGLCAFTKSICRGGKNGEAEMKALVTAENLGLNTIDVPCAAQTGLPPSMNCSIPLAPGINATMHQTEIAAFVDGPRPEPADLDEGESMITLITSLVIALGSIGCLCSVCLTVVCCVRRLKASGLDNSMPSPALTSQ